MLSFYEAKQRICRRWDLSHRRLMRAINSKTAKALGRTMRADQVIE